MAVSINEFDADNIVFGDVVDGKSGEILYARIPIKYRRNDKLEELCIATPELSSYGLQEIRKNLSKIATDPVESYSLSLVMSDPATTAVFERILKACKDHLFLQSTKRALKKGGDQLDGLTMSMDIFSRKRDNGQIVAGANPTLYPKVYTKFIKDGDKTTPPPIQTEFYDDEGDIDPLTLVGVRIKVSAAISIKDIFVGAKPSIQIKLNEVYVAERLATMQRMLKIPDRSS
jgi:Protein of unknown function (DUF2738)